MRTLIRLGLLLTGFLLLIMTLGSHILRQKPSTAYWMAGIVADGQSRKVVVSTPNGKIQSVVYSAPFSSEIHLVDWLPDERSFLYFERDYLSTTIVRRYWLDLHDSTTYTHLPTQPSVYDLRIDPIPNRDEYTIILQSPQPAIYLMNHHGDVIRQMTPFYDSIRSQPVWSSDGEWLYYVAVETNDTIPNLYRHRYDGSQHSIISSDRIEGTVEFNQVTPEDAFFQVYPTLERSQIYHLSTADGVLSPATPDVGAFNLMGYTDTWLFLTEYILSEGELLRYVSRVASDGSGYARLMEIDFVTDRFHLQYAPTPDTYIVRIPRNGHEALYQLNLETGELEILFSPTQFTQILSTTPTDDDDVFLFLAISDETTGLYRFDLATNLLEMVNLLPLGTNADNSNVLYWIMGVFEDDVLLREAERTTFFAIGDLYRINYKTGERDLLLLDRSSGNQVAYPVPHDDGKTIISIEHFDNNYIVSHQVLVDMQSGETKPLSVGNDLIFSPTIDLAWNPSINRWIGLAFMLITIFWSILNFWQYARSSLDIPSTT